MPRNASRNDGTSRRKKKKKITVMEGQTDTERRQLRASLREQNRKIQLKGDDIEDPLKEAYAESRAKSNVLFSQIRYTREAVLDADNLHLTSSKVSMQASKMLQVPRYDPIRFQQKIRSHFSSRQGFDWKALGVQAGVCFNSVPSRVRFLSGPLQADYQPKERKSRQAKRTQKEAPVEEEKPEEMREQDRKDKDPNRLSAVEKQFHELDKVLQRKTNAAFLAQKAEIDSLPKEEQEAAEEILRGKEAEIDGIKFLFNPNSFTQTVENVFHFSFLVKNGRARVRVDEGEGLKLRHTDLLDEAKAGGSKQTITSFTMRDWRRLCKAYAVQKGMLKHRASSRKRAATQDPEDDAE